MISLVILITLFIARPWIERTLNNINNTKEYSIDFIDDSGYRIRMEKPAGTIISLYSAHTENLYSLGLDREIVGVGSSEIYPYSVLQKTVYDYRSDPERVLAVHPDVVFIRPFIERHSPDFVKSLRRAGIIVVSLYPDNFNEFDDYILKLGLITGKTKTARKKLEAFHLELEELREDFEGIESVVKVYFESSDREYKTVTKNSFAAYAIDIAGGINIANDAVAIEEGSSIAIYGVEKILEKADEIDVYVTQRGVMGAGGNYHSISIRPGFYAIKAIINNRILEINQKIISCPTFRFTKGVKTLKRSFYPEKYDVIKKYDDDYNITRFELAEILIKYIHEPIFVPTKSYYKDLDKTHYYGNFKDVLIDDIRFDIIETSMRKSFFKSEVVDGEEYFYPDKNVTREEFARIIYILSDLKNNDDILIKDIENINNVNIIKAVISNKLMNLENGYFYPDKFIIFKDIKKGLGL